MLMKSNVNFIAETGPHKPLVAGSNPAAASFYIRGPEPKGWHLGQKQVSRFCTGTRSPGPPTATMSHAAPEKVVMFCISTVVLPVPPAEVACPLVSVSQKELLTASKDS